MTALRLAPFEPDDLKRLSDFAGQESMVFHLKDRDVADLRDRGKAFTGYIGDQIVGVGGFVEANRYRAAAWVLFQKTAPKLFPAIHKGVCRLIAMQPYRRIEAYVDPKSPPAMRWIAMLGFEIAVPYRPYFFPDGSGASEWVLYPRG